MSGPTIPTSKLKKANFLGNLTDDAWAYFLCNVGDGDAQLVLLPVDQTGTRKAIVVDAFSDKVIRLITHLTDVGLLPGNSKDIALVVATHPHHDHISSMPNLLRTHGNRVTEFWDPGYYHPINAYTSMMKELEKDTSGILYAQPVAGFRRWIGGSSVTVLSPATGLRNRFDTYGTEINDSSISLRIENPAVWQQTRDAAGQLIEAKGKRWSLILGGDAQTLSWANVMVDFPYLPASNTEAAKAIAAATGTKDLLSTDVVKVSHHGSKRGINLELMERFAAGVVLVSSRAPGEGHHNFPHELTTEIIREVKEPRATEKTPKPRKADWENRIFFTHDRDSADTELGTVGVVFKGGARQIWRFDDGRSQPIDIAQARRLS